MLEDFIADIVEETMDKLRDMVENNKLSDTKCNNFISNREWESEFSHNDIGEIQEEFIKQAKEYLIKECKDKYIIYCDWCVHICSIEFFNNNIKGYIRRYETC